MPIESCDNSFGRYRIGLHPYCVGPNCGFSTYYNGTEEVNVDFVYRAPLYLDDDSVQTKLSSTCDLVAGETFKVKVYVESGDLNTFDVPFFVDSDITSSSIDIQYISGSQSLRFTWDDDTGAQKSQIFDKPMVFDKWIEITVTTGATFECTIDGTSYSGSAVVGGASVINRITVGARNTTPSNPVTALFESFESVCAGVVSFISNQDDGKSFIADIGEVWNLSEDVAGSSQIKADGTSSTAYAWPDAVKLRLPAVGYSQFDLTNVLSQSIATKVNIDFSAEWVMVIENLFVASDAVDDCQIVQWNDILGRTLTFVYDQTNRRFRCTVFDGTSNKTVNVGSLGTPIEYDTRYHVIIRSVGGTIAARPYEMEVVGYGGTNIDTDTLDFTPYTVQNTSFFNVGGVGKKYSGKIGNIRWVTPTGGTYFDTFPLETRVPADTDPNVDDIVGLDNSSILEASVDRSYKFPYFGASQYLVSDTPCVGDALLTSGGAFMLSGGCPMVRSAWNPGYSKTSYTGGEDHIIYLGDSNAQTNAFPGEGITPYPDRHAAYCAQWLPDVTITNIALSGLSLYGMTEASYDRVKPYNTDPSLGLVGRYASVIEHNLEKAVALGATMVVMSSGVATWTNSFTEGPYLAYEDIQIFTRAKIYLDGFGIKLIAMTPVASKAVSVLLDATGLNTMSSQYKSILPSLGIDFLDENGIMRQGTDYIPDSLMKDDTHKNNDGQIYLTENEIIPGFDRIFNMR